MSSFIRLVFHLNNIDFFCRKLNKYKIPLSWRRLILFKSLVSLFFFPFLFINLNVTDIYLLSKLLLRLKIFRKMCIFFVFSFLLFFSSFCPLCFSSDSKVSELLKKFEKKVILARRVRIFFKS